jgi:hypothetical protein
VALRSPSRTSSASRSVPKGPASDGRSSGPVHPPLGFVAPSALPARRVHFPEQVVGWSSRSLPVPAPRRGVPRPLRSASVVSHDLDGLLLSEPGGFFQPHTPLGFGLPAPGRGLRARCRARELPGSGGRHPPEGTRSLRSAHPSVRRMVTPSTAPDAYTPGPAPAPLRRLGTMGAPSTRSRGCSPVGAIHREITADPQRDAHAGATVQDLQRLPLPASPTSRRHVAAAPGGSHPGANPMGSPAPPAMVSLDALTEHVFSLDPAP